MEDQLGTAFRPSKTNFDFLSGSGQSVTETVARRADINPEINMEIKENLTLGQRLADRVTLFGGSWTFLIYFGVLLFAWVLVNSVLLPRQATFDPYPYIFLNLVLSMMRAVQAPVIMMSQNRQDEKDRLAMMHDYEVNLKTEREIQGLHRKLDRLTALHQAEMKQLLRLLEQKAEENTPDREVNFTKLFEDSYSSQLEAPKLSGFSSDKALEFRQER